ncbi:MAG TPA: protein phosphatase 2C domain-containing protein [Ktedonobacterales bacterium]|nr:protein phosphatase 2C domain-containing protein [Ktedonobacterales bacterium]
MRCRRCGAVLRETARFCNVCGMMQPQTPQPGSDALSTDTAEQPGRLKRPDRPLRPDAALGPGFAAPPTLPPAQLPRMPPSRATILLNDHAAPPTGALDGSPDRLDVISSTPTNEYAVVTPINGPTPWPLPVGDMLQGRFRVEAVVSDSPDVPGAENVYHVIDLLGFERCWSCGTQHGAAGQGERFCPQCGADMIGHELRMTEQREETDHDTRPELPVAPDEAEAAARGRVFARDGRRYRVEEIAREGIRFPNGPHVTIVGMSDVGLTRADETNEDSFGALALNLAHDSRRQPLAIAIVADGLGGHASGQDASRIAARIFIEKLTNSLAIPFMAPLGSSLPPDEAVEGALVEAAQAANSAVYQANVNGAGDMGSTLVALVIVGENAWIANCGDSRAYVMDGDALRRVTSDHSLVEQLILSGMLAPEDRYTHPQRNRIFRSLGGEQTVELDVFTQKLRPGMRLLLCSDGLWEMTRDSEIEQILRTTEDPYEACRALIESANEHGGEDNITGVIAQIDA